MATTSTTATTATPTSAPTNKAVAATTGSALGAATATLIIWGLGHLVSLPAEVQAAITTLVTALFTLAAAYYTPPGSGEAVVMGADGRPRTARVTQPATV